MDYVFSFVFPFLAATALLQWLWGFAGWRTNGPAPALVPAVFGAVLVCIPIGGLPVARWLASLNASFSIPFTALLLSMVWGRIFGRPLLDDRALRTCRLFGVIAGMALYPMAMGLSRFDPYVLGWDFSLFFVLLLAATLLLLLRGDRFGIVLTAVILAYNLKVLESPNLWDYAVDPFYVIVSVAGLVYSTVRRRMPGATPGEG